MSWFDALNPPPGPLPIWEGEQPTPQPLPNWEGEQDHFPSPLRGGVRVYD